MPLFRKILLLTVYVIIATLVTTFVQVLLLRWHDPKTTAWMRMRVREAKAQGKDLQIHHTWIPLKAISPPMKAAVVAAEDDGFYQHHGFDWDAMRKAHELNEKKERIKRGGSTITQQLAKNLYLSPSRSYWRKGREAVITAFMELLLPKDRILELYLNSIEFGPGVFGIEEAARHYFNISARQLSLYQCCQLAAIIPSPLRYRTGGSYVNRRAGNIARIIGGGNAVQDSSF
ncbi:MAG TPA: monofunctional biosynthetic peptidoglycan transglycosylase [bacterium]